MKITKLGHCCLLIEESNLRILTDPGSWTVDAHKNLDNIDIILITHEHADHMHVDSLKMILEKSPNAIIVTNSGVGKLLDADEIPYTLVEHGGRYDGGTLIEGYGETHQEIYGEFGQVQNTGYFIASRLFYPGDAFYNPNRSIDILALPVAGPWMSMKQAIDYAIAIKPKKAFPVHDGMIKEAILAKGPFHGIPSAILPQHGIEFIPLVEGDSIEF